MVNGFKPIYRKNSKILILGSAPSVISLKKYEYYGNKRNRFWDIISDIYSRSPFETYDEKINFIINNNIFLWDVVNTCERKGSLDSDIRDVIVNDLIKVLDKNESLRVVMFNGKKAYNLYKKHIHYYPINIDFIVLPSTSPAYTLAYEKKLVTWKSEFNKYK
ncbi:MAG: DNA-deoxyinosine glycosylase [Pleomorphochaeta sp.]